jgi:hypothetical protein
VNDSHGNNVVGRNLPSQQPLRVPELDVTPRSPLLATHSTPSRWQFWRRASRRDYSEQYKAPRWWQRLFSLVSLAVISLTAGVMVAVAIAAAVAAVAIALQSLVT